MNGLRTQRDVPLFTPAGPKRVWQVHSACHTAPYPIFCHLYSDRYTALCQNMSLHGVSDASSQLILSALWVGHQYKTQNRSHTLARYGKHVLQKRRSQNEKHKSTSKAGKADLGEANVGHRFLNFPEARVTTSGPDSSVVASLTNEGHSILPAPVRPKSMRHYPLVREDCPTISVPEDKIAVTGVWNVHKI